MFFMTIPIISAPDILKAIGESMIGLIDFSQHNKITNLMRLVLNYISDKKKRLPEIK